MPVRAAVFQLPPDGRQWLRQELIRNGCSDFARLSEQVRERFGVSMSKSAIHRYSQTLPPETRYLLRETDGKPLHQIEKERRRQRQPPRGRNPATARRGGQRERIKADLLAGRRVTQQAAIAEHGCYRLAAVIQRIRRVDGWPVETVLEAGGCARYQLPSDFTPQED